MKTLILLSLASIMWSTNALADRIVVRDYLATRYPDMPPAGAHRYEVEDGSTLVSVSVCVHHLHQMGETWHETYGFESVSGTYTVPAEINGWIGVEDAVGEDEPYSCRILELKGGAGFSTFQDLTHVVVSEGIETLNLAFDLCTNLQTACLPSTLKRLDGAFYGCQNLTTVSLPDGVVDIGQGSFNGCSRLSCVRLSPNLTSVGESSFRDCVSLTDICLPSGSKAIGKYAFRGCESLTNVSWGVCEDIGESAFSGCTALPQAEIPDSVTNIEQRAFSGCISLERVHFPLQLKEIGASAFADCSSLADIMLPDGVQKLASSVFRDCCAVNKVRLPASLTSFQSDTFSKVMPGELLTAQYCSMMKATSVTNLIILPGMTAYSPNNLYRGGEFSRVELPETVTSIGSSAFIDNTNLSEVVVRGSVGSVGDKAFYGCTAMEILPDFNGALTNMGTEVFRGCTGLREVRIPSSLREIPSKAFYFCTNIERLVVSEGVETISADAFFYDYNIRELSLPSTATDLRSNSYKTYPHVQGVATFHQMSPPENLKKVFLSEFSGTIYYPPAGEMAWRAFLEGEGLGELAKSWAEASEDDSGVVRVNDVPVRYGWLAKYGLTNTRSPEEAARASLGKRDAVGSEMFVWQDFVAGTDPTNENSRFVATITFENGLPIVGWSPKFAQPADEALRAYTIWGKKDLLEQDWIKVDRNSNADYNFFKVTVDMVGETDLN